MKKIKTYRRELVDVECGELKWAVVNRVNCDQGSMQVFEPKEFLIARFELQRDAREYARFFEANHYYATLEVREIMEAS